MASGLDSLFASAFMHYETNPSRTSCNPLISDLQNGLSHLAFSHVVKHVLFKGLRLVLEGSVVTMHEGACETGSKIPRDLTYCSHKPQNPDRSVLITNITWHFPFCPVNVSILHLKYDYPHLPDWPTEWLLWQWQYPGTFKGCGVKTLKYMFCGVSPSDLSRNMDIKHWGVLTWICNATLVFMAQIGQYFVDRRLCTDVIWHVHIFT